MNKKKFLKRSLKPGQLSSTFIFGFEYNVDSLISEPDFAGYRLNDSKRLKQPYAFSKMGKPKGVIVKMYTHSEMKL